MSSLIERISKDSLRYMCRNLLLEEVARLAQCSKYMYSVLKPTLRRYQHRSTPDSLRKEIDTQYMKDRTYIEDYNNGILDIFCTEPLIRRDCCSYRPKYSFSDKYLKLPEYSTLSLEQRRRIILIYIKYNERSLSCFPKRGKTRHHFVFNFHNIHDKKDLEMLGPRIMYYIRMVLKNHLKDNPPPGVKWLDDDDLALCWRRYINNNPIPERMRLVPKRLRDHPLYTEKRYRRYLV